jgi:hypothetical protein
MKKAYIEYCIDGYNLIQKEVIVLYDQLNEIKKETQEIFKAPFGVDVVIDNIGRISIGLADQTILCYKSDDFEIQLTAVGNIDAQGETMFYFGDYSSMSNKYLISFDSGVEIINEWIKYGILPAKVDWTEEIL